MAKIIVLGAMKGGVGKSVSTYNLAYSLNKLGKKVLVVDFDSSANITRCVAEDIKTVEISIGDLMMNQMDEEEQPNPAEYIIIDDLNIRRGPGTHFAKTGDYTGIGVFTIVAECMGLGSKKGWGKLKSGRGWISLDYTDKI